MDSSDHLVDSTGSKIYPWQLDQWEKIRVMQHNERLPHALLIAGNKGTGIHEFAINIAASVLCLNRNAIGENCQECSSCQLLAADTHPDLQLITPEEEGKAIKIDQIRKLLNFTQLQSHYSQRKVVIISPADAMNSSSANSLLKTLEEPPGDCLIILVCQQTSLLPATVRSRCQKLKISASSVHIKAYLDSKLKPEQIEAIISSGWGPLLANEDSEKDNSLDRTELLADLEAIKSAQQDPLEIAERWAKTDAKETFFWLIKLCQDMLRLKSVDTIRKNEAEHVLQKRLNDLAEGYDLKGIFQLYDKLNEYYKLLSFNTSLKASTMLENFAIEWGRLKKQ